MSASTARADAASPAASRTMIFQNDREPRHWFMLAMLVATVPAFYLELLSGADSWIGSTVYALAAVRIGYCIAQPERARAIRMLLAPSRNGPGLSAAAVSYRDTDYLAASNRAMEQGRQVLYRACDTVKIPYLRSHGSYVWANFFTARTIKRLEAEGVMLRLFAGAAPGWARAAVADPTAMAHFARV